MSRSLFLATLAALTIASVARADRAEWYVAPSVGPEFLRLVEPTRRASRVTKPAVGFGLSSLYGLSNSLHLGAELHFASLSNVAFAGSTLTLADGSTPTGALYANQSVFAVAAVAEYRFLLPSDFAPLVELGAGPAFARSSQLALYPAATHLEIDSPDRSDIGLSLKARVGVDYRAGNHLSFSVAFEVRRNLGLDVPWEFEVPVSAAYVW